MIRRTPKLAKLKDLERQMDHASSYEEWTQAALEHDSISGRQRWREDDRCRLYDFAQIRDRFERLQALRSQQDYSGLLYALNEGIHGNMGGMGRASLYGKAKFGTKRLIEDYIGEIAQSLQLLARLDGDQVSPESRLEFFHRANVCFGRTALMLSGGGVLGYYHLGVVKALLEQKVLPTVISGSSAGAFIAGMVGTRTDDEMDELFRGDRLHHEPDSLTDNSLLERLVYGEHRQLTRPDIESLIEHLIPDYTFQEAFEKTGRQINISVAPAELHQGSRLLNAITSPNVYIRSAVLASGAVPGFYEPVTLAARSAEGKARPYHPSRRWIDGSFADDLPAKRLSRLYGVNHTIVSMVNPLIFPLLGGSDHAPQIYTDFKMALHSLYAGMSREIFGFYRFVTRRRSGRLPFSDIWINMIHGVIDQDYTGDINILPRFNWYDPRKMLAHASQDDRNELIQQGERSAYYHVETIRSCTLISRTLDEILGETDRVAAVPG